MNSKYPKPPFPGHPYHELSDEALAALMKLDSYEALAILHWRIAPPPG